MNNKGSAGNNGVAKNETLLNVGNKGEALKSIENLPLKYTKKCKGLL